MYTKKLNHLFVLCLFCNLFVCIAIAQVSFTKNNQSFGTGINDIAFGDVNADGFPDAIIAKGNWNVSYNNELWLNDKNGNFYITNQDLGSNGFGVALADLNADNYLDIFIATGRYSDPIPSEKYFNNGDGIFTKSDQKIAENKNTGSVILADFNNNGYSDALICNVPAQNYDTCEMELWLNDGNGNLTKSVPPLGQERTRHYRFRLSDIDADGDMDIVSSSWGFEIDSKTEIWTNDGNANFTSKLLSNEYGTLILGDIDGVMGTDIIVVGKNNYINDGAGNFTAEDHSFDSVQCNWGEIADLDKDGDLDIVLANGVDGGDDFPNAIWINNGNGTFTKSEFQFIMNDGIQVELFDVDNDSDVDIIFSNSVWINNLVTSSVNSNIINDFKIYPILSGDCIYLKNIGNSALNFEYNLYNTSGQLIIQGYTIDNSINISNLNKGTYILQLRANQELINKTIVIY